MVADTRLANIRHASPQALCRVEDGLRPRKDRRGELNASSRGEMPRDDGRGSRSFAEAIEEVCAERGRKASSSPPTSFAGSDCHLRIGGRGSQGMDLAKARGAKLVKELVVSGAFHSPLMEGPGG